MKVLSIKEPFATLIKDKNKRIETRSFKTNYRGVLYIHASLKASDVTKRKDLVSLIGNRKMNNGNIICKCNLIDCVYMTKEYVENLKKNNYQEYICGHYEIGRYAWILSDIEPLKEPIKAKGELGIWNYYNENEIMYLMQDIEYGWIDKDNNKHMNVDDKFQNDYILQSPKEVIKNKIGVCWDQVELERYYFKNYVKNVKTYFLVYDGGDKCPSHTFLTFEKNNKYYWFEHSWERFRGIHEYNSLKDLLLDVRDKFISVELHNDYKKLFLLLHEYTKPKYHIGTQEFFNHCDFSDYIDFDEL